MSGKIQKLQLLYIQCYHEQLDGHVSQTQSKVQLAAHTAMWPSQREPQWRYTETQIDTMCVSVDPDVTEVTCWFQPERHCQVLANIPHKFFCCSHYDNRTTINNKTTMGVRDPVWKEGNLTGSSSDQRWDCSDFWQDVWPAEGSAVPVLRARQLALVALEVTSDSDSDSWRERQC